MKCLSRFLVSGDENLKMQSLKTYFDKILYLLQEEKDTIKSPHDHVLGGVADLNSPLLGSRQIKRKISEERMPGEGIEAGSLPEGRFTPGGIFRAE